jgi:hypothetical protein
MDIAATEKYIFALQFLSYYLLSNVGHLINTLFTKSVVLSAAKKKLILFTNYNLHSTQ